MLSVGHLWSSDASDVIQGLLEPLWFNFHELLPKLLQIFHEEPVSCKVCLTWLCQVKWVPYPDLWRLEFSNGEDALQMWRVAENMC